jgi:hypothetical protein
MKSQLKSARRSSKTAAPSQSKTAPPGAEFHPARGGLTVPILHPDDTEWARVEFNAAERRRIEAFLKATGFTLQELIEKAVASRVESISAEAAASIPKTRVPEEPDLVTGRIVLNLATEGGTGLGTLTIDDFESELLQKAAVLSRLSLTGLLNFIVYRQLEAFYPPGVEKLYRVTDSAVDEVSNGLAWAERDSNALWAVSSSLVARLDNNCDCTSPADCSAAICELGALAACIEDLSSRVRSNVSEAHMHWKIAARPALLEQRVAPVSIPSSRTAQPSVQRRAA